jgi:prophage maintenance system killer protein
MTTLDVADLVVIAGQTLGTGTDAALRQLDLTAARAALTQAADSPDAVIADQDTAAQAAITLMHALLRHRPFPVCGEQIAVAAGLQFLSLNGWQAELDPPAAAAVVVESLACGQLSPVGAAAWLSPRLTADIRLSAQRGTVRGFRLPQAVSAAVQAASPSTFYRKAIMRDTSAPLPEPIQPAASRKPASVTYPQALLFIQAGCWALATVAGLTGYIAALANSAAPWPGLLPLAGLALAGGLAVAKARLGLRVDRIRSRRTWQLIIGTELAMTCFGMLWLFIPAPGFIAAGFFGALLSLAAVLCMTRPRARRHFTDPDALPGIPDPGALPGPADFWQLALTSHGAAVV